MLRRELKFFTYYIVLERLISGVYALAVPVNMMSVEVAAHQQTAPTSDVGSILPDPPSP